MDKVDTEAIKITSMIRASEQWSDQYAQDTNTHAKLIKQEAKYQVQLAKFFRGLGDDAAQIINPYAYTSQVRADYNIDVIVNTNQLDQYANAFITVSFETVSVMLANGAQAGEAIYSIPLGIQSTDAIIQKLTKQHVAALVGMKVQDDGSIVKNPKAQFNITETMRRDIVESVKTSLALGEDIQTAIERVRKTIANPKRAELIAQTESVNAYQSGLDQFGFQSGAVGKESQSVGAVDQCLTYQKLGPVPFDYLYDGIFKGPTYHPRCRCGKRLIYKEEWDRLVAAGEVTIVSL